MEGHLFIFKLDPGYSFIKTIIIVLVYLLNTFHLRLAIKRFPEKIFHIDAACSESRKLMSE